MAGEYDSGLAFFPEGRYVDSSSLNDILGDHNHFPCNTTGPLEVWTTNPDLKARTQWECINYVSQDDLRELGCNWLFEFLVSEVSTVRWVLLGNHIVWASLGVMVTRKTWKQRSTNTLIPSLCQPNKVSRASLCTPQSNCCRVSQWPCSIWGGERLTVGSIAFGAPTANTTVMSLAMSTRGISILRKDLQVDGGLSAIAVAQQRPCWTSWGSMQLTCCCPLQRSWRCPHQRLLMLVVIRRGLFAFHLRGASLMLSGGHGIYRDISIGVIEGSLVMSTSSPYSLEINLSWIWQQATHNCFWLKTLIHSGEGIGNSDSGLLWMWINWILVIELWFRTAPALSALESSLEYFLIQKWLVSRLKSYK